MKHGDATYRILTLLGMRPKGWRRLEISEELQIPRCSVDESLSDLKRDGLVVVKPIHVKGAVGRPVNRYYCTIEGVTALNAAYRRRGKRG